MLLFLCTAQTLSFIRLIEKPDLRNAIYWVLLSDLAVLTHYHAGVLTAVQGIVFLVVARRRAFATWPAAMLFLPALGWIMFHLPRVLEFAAPNVAWYSRLQLIDLPALLAYAAGGVAGLIALATIQLLAIRTQKEQPPSEAEERPRSLVAASLASVAALAAIVALGFLTPSFSPRYLIPTLPGITLGIMLLAGHLSRGWMGAYAILMAGYLVTCAALTLSSMGRPSFSFEKAAADLSRAGVHHLVFSWDHPASAILTPEQLKALGGFFFARAQHPVDVTPVTMTPGDDASARLLKAAAVPESGILWLYDLSVPQTAAASSPPRIEALAPRWNCRNYGSGAVGILACLPDGEAQAQ